MNTLQASPTAVMSSIAATRRTDWPAMLVGAVIAAAVLLGLMALGAALGLSAVSPWSPRSSATAVGVVAVLFLAFAHFLSGGIGGYVAARLRSVRETSSSDERAYGDGLHGLGVWGTTTVASAVIGAVIAMTTTLAAVNAAGQVAAAATPAAAQSLARAAPAAEYWADQLLRGDQNATAPQGGSNPAAEISRIIATGLAAGEVPASDKDYLARIVTNRTGLSAAAARERVDTLVQQAQSAAARAAAAAKEAADTARKAVAAAAFWTTVVIFLTAGFAWYGSTLGGRHRDQDIYA